MSIQQHITTLVVEVDPDSANDEVVRIKIPGISYRGSDLFVDINLDYWREQLHPIDRLEVGFGLAMEGMKHGLKFARKDWSRHRIGLADDRMTNEVQDERGQWTLLVMSDSATMLIADVLANDWVVAP